jgi:hypothetical protein
MATSKTFILDESTVTLLQDASAVLAKPESEIVREAIVDFHSRLGRLSQRERINMLRVLDEFASVTPDRSGSDVDREIAEIRRARRSGGRRANRRIKA